MRRNAKDERILFHYNGHGVPRPTSNGEIWVFNRNFTQYIPLSLYELQHWLGSPSIFVWDCNAAGLIVKTFQHFAEQRRAELERSSNRAPGTPATPGSPGSPGGPIGDDYIHLASCGPNEILPTNPNLPADVFTSCLTTPIKIALKWFVSQTIITGVTYDLIDKIPGRLNDRRTPLGELNWIFTAVTDTIAWNVLPRPLFQKLFRQDLLVASLFRNFLLAERIMRSCRCTPSSYPKLPPTYNHPMWQAWDLAADYCLVQLPKLLANPNAEFKNCSFFTEQLTAFEVWLEFGSEEKKPPEQLPIVLQVLLSQQHRLRALVLLARFLDLGPWAVNQALSVGIFPYVLKLLQSPATELREVLVFIWAKILALDKSCQLDLVKDNGQFYFINVLANTRIPANQRTQAAFIISVVCNNCRPGQSACLSARLLQICLAQLNEPDSMLRRWVVFALAKLWENYEEAKWAAIREAAHEKLCILLTDPVPEVRAAAVYALGTFIGNSNNPAAVDAAGQAQMQQIQQMQQQAGVAPAFPGPSSAGNQMPADAAPQRTEQRVQIELKLGLTLAVVTADASPMVRKELIVTLAGLVQAHQEQFAEEVKHQIREEFKVKLEMERAKRKMQQQAKSSKGSSSARSATSDPAHEDSDDGFAEPERDEQSRIFEFIWKSVVLSLLNDPFPEIAQIAQTLVGRLRQQVSSTFAPSSSSSIGVPSLYDTSSPSGSVGSGGSDFFRRAASSTGLMSESLGSGSSSNSSTPRGSAGARSPVKGSTPQSGGRGGLTASTNLAPPSAQKKIEKRYNSISNLLNLRKSDQPANDDDDSDDGDDGPSSRRSGESASHSGDSHAGSISDEIRSNLYEWCCTYFSAPLNKPTEEDETAPDYSQRRWRQQRNEHLIKEAKSFIDKGTKKLENEIAILENESHMVSLLLFHPFENMVVVADEKDGLSVWNWEEGVKINHFSNCNPPMARITSMSLINEHDIAMICAGSGTRCLCLFNPDSCCPICLFQMRIWVSKSWGDPFTDLFLAISYTVFFSDDGVVRIWNGIYSHDTVRLVTAWKVVADLPLISRNTGAGVVIDWQQSSEMLYAGGNVDVIRVWDLQRELSLLNIPTSADSPVTCLNVDKEGGKLVVAGCADGSVRLYDVRQSNKYSPVAVFAEHKGPVINVAKPKSTPFRLVSGATGGTVKFWDYRVATSNSSASTVVAPAQTGANNSIALKTITAHTHSVMTALSVHDYAPLIATGSQDQRIKVMNFNGDELSVIRYHDGFLGQRIGPVSSLAFHPYHVLLAAGATDSLVSIYAGETFKSTGN
jgi:regulatory associated protein of mTOR